MLVSVGALNKLYVYKLFVEHGNVAVDKHEDPYSSSAQM